MKPHKKVERLMLFSAVAETLSFGAAAEKMQISRGYLSEQIRQLELALGVKLLQRSTRQVSLTNEGKQVYADTQKINRSVIELEQNLVREQTQLEGVIAITAPNMFAHYLLSDLCFSFSEQHPDVSFHLDTSYQRHDLNRGHFDLAFRSTNNPPQDMVAKPLLTYSHAIVTAPQYLEKNGTPKVLSDLDAHQCFCGPAQDSWLIHGNRTTVKGWLKLNDNLALIQQVLAGRGIARLPSYVAKKHIMAGELVALFEEIEPGATLDAPSVKSTSQLFIVHPQRPHQSLRIKAFLNTVKQAQDDGYFSG
ncbi:LysR family transcriptional regulator [Alteromonas mediterranea]|uniref:LysR family transcriptional regulator n=1 Tax=Alteromonas mediterranea TaxID=314275 RepID=A0AAC9J9V7_9ALTE|nr:LysR family transcriptional regulator [Alteromonas mediterranea]APD88976.1 LysR family transcriptional regulator [Alteromonas mediterranea]APD93176.1 LysR family transcriptional regulator [Alteromonas mediterranea]APD96789.1 LysR family transcriptional regulator [Alteromonas mediterranea]QDG33911.1 LysR family transcriptional regulator [Alteromonas mediterranea]